jgi:hypothetical protein
MKEIMQSELIETWATQKAKLKQKFAALTETDMLFIEETKEEMIENLQRKLGKSKEELSKIIQAL